MYTAKLTTCTCLDTCTCTCMPCDIHVHVHVPYSSRLKIFTGQTIVVKTFSREIARCKTKLEGRPQRLNLFFKQNSAKLQNISS